MVKKKSIKLVIEEGENNFIFIFWISCILLVNFCVVSFCEYFRKFLKNKCSKWWLVNVIIFIYSYSE